MNAGFTEDGMINGKVRVLNSDHNAIAFRESYFEDTEEAFLDDLEVENGDIEISEFTVKNAKDTNKPVISSYDYTKEDGMDIISDKIYFSPMFFFRSTENPFKLEKREFPIDFGYPSGEEYTFSIMLPENYEVETVPGPLAIALPDGMGAFRYTIMSTPNMVQLKVVSEINNAIIPALYYDSLKEYYKKVIEKMNEKVVLSKISDNGHTESAAGGR